MTDHSRDLAGIRLGIVCGISYGDPAGHVLEPRARGAVSTEAEASR